MSSRFTVLNVVSFHGYVPYYQSGLSELNKKNGMGWVPPLVRPTNMKFTVWGRSNGLFATCLDSKNQQHNLTVEHVYSIWDAFKLLKCVFSIFFGPEVPRLLHPGILDGAFQLMILAHQRIFGAEAADRPCLLPFSVDECVLACDAPKGHPGDRGDRVFLAMRIVTTESLDVWYCLICQTFCCYILII